MVVDVFAELSIGETDQETAPEVALRSIQQLLTDIEDPQSRGIDTNTLDAINRGDATAIELREVAAIVALEEPIDAEAIHAELLDQLLIEMTTAVVDVDTLATLVMLPLNGKDVQQRIEGRSPITLQEYAIIRQAINAE